MVLPEITAFNGEEHLPFTLNGGNGRAVLLVHGFPGSPDEMRPFAHLFHDLGWTARAMLLPGFGAQINSLPQRTYDEWLSAIMDELRALKREYAQVALCGHSMGGAMAINAAADFQPDGLILLAPFYTLDNVLWGSLPALQRIFPTFKPFRLFKPDFNNPETREGILRFMPELDLDDPQTRAAVMEFELPVKMLAQIHKAGQNGYRNAPHIHCPTLIVQGHRDELVTPANTRKLSARIKAPLTYIEVDAEHNLHATDQAAWGRIREAIAGFAHTFETAAHTRKEA